MPDLIAGNKVSQFENLIFKNNVDAEKAIATAKMLAKVKAKLTPKQVSEKMHASRYKKNKSHEAVFDGPTPDEMHAAGEGYHSTNCQTSI